MEKVIDLPLDGPPVSEFPAVEHRCGLSGLIVHALPPGVTSLRAQHTSHLIDVNYSAPRGHLAVNSDKAKSTRYGRETTALYPSGTDFRIRAYNDAWGTLIEIDPARLAPLFMEVADSRFESIAFTDYRTLPQTAVLGRMLVDHLRLVTVNALYAEGLGLAITGATFANALGIKDASATGNERRVQRARDYIEAHLATIDSVAEAAAAAAMSASHFTRCFREITGEAPWAYVLRRRTERAIERIRLTRDSITLIAFDCGFADASAISAAVRSKTGMTPTQLRAS